MTLDDLGPITLETLPSILEKLTAKVGIIQQRGRFLWIATVMAADWKKLKRPLSDFRYGAGEGASPTAAIRAALKAFIEYKPYIPQGTVQPTEDFELPQLRLDTKDLK